MPAGIGDWNTAKSVGRGRCREGGLWGPRGCGQWEGRLRLLIPCSTREKPEGTGTGGTEHISACYVLPATSSTMIPET